LAVLAVFLEADGCGKNASLAAQDLRSHIFQRLLIAALLLAVSRCRLPTPGCYAAASSKK
jgi:hypothetical protein